MSISRDRYDAMEATYRNEGLSVGNDHMRLYGEDIKLEVAISDLILGNRIGQGACSSVNMARHRITGEVFAIKMFNVYDKGQASQLYNEILLLTSFQCDALITLKGAFHDEGSIGVIIEYMDKGSLEFIMEPQVDINERVMAAIAFQILWGLGYLHYEKQIHRDVKPGNILMNSLGQVKLSDFGISKELDNSIAMSNTSVGSYRYMSPERLRGEKYDAAGDIWSVGISIIELWEKAYPFLNIADTPISLLGELEKVSFSRLISRSSARYSREMTEFLLYTLEPNPGRRMGAADLMSSSWFEATGITSLPEAHSVVAQWVNSLNRGSRRSADPSLNSSSNSHSLPRGASLANGRPPRKDANEMSISMESSRSSLAAQHAHAQYGGGQYHNASGVIEDLGISRELSKGLSNNPFTSSGSFTMNSSSFSAGTGSMASSSGGVASVAHAGGMGHHPHSSHGAHNHGMNAAASRFRMAQDIGRGTVPEGDEYEQDEFEVDDEEEDVHRYDDSGYDYKHQEEKKSSGGGYRYNRTTPRK